MLRHLVINGKPHLYSIFAMLLFISAGHGSDKQNPLAGLCEPSLQTPQVKTAWKELLAGNLKAATKAAKDASDNSPNNHMAHAATALTANAYSQYEKGFQASCQALKYSANSPWWELYLHDAMLLAEHTSDITPLRNALGEALSNPQSTALTKLMARHAEAKLTFNLKERSKLMYNLPFIRNWQILGPFNNREKSGFEQTYAPEKEFPHQFDPKQTYAGRSRKIKWMPLKQVAADGRVNLSAILYPNDENVAYALAQIECPQAMEVTFVLGNSGAGSLWIGAEHIARWNTYHGYTPFQRVFTRNLPKGRSSIMLKLAGERQKELIFSLAVMSGNQKTTDQQKLPNVTICNDYIPQAKTDAPSKLTKASDYAGLYWGSLGLMLKSAATSPAPSPVATANTGYLLMMRQLDDDLHTQTRPPLAAAAAAAPNCAFIRELAALSETDTNATRTHLKAIRKISPDETQGQELELMFMHQNGFTREAEAKAKALLKITPITTAHEILGDIYYDRKWKPEALNAWKRAVRLQPGRAILYLKISTHTTGINAQEKVLRRGIARTGDVKLYDTLTDLLREGPQAGWEEADRIAQDLIMLDPFNLSAHSTRYHVALARGNLTAAQDIARNALSHMPDAPHLLESLGEIALEKGHKKEAVRLWQKALALRPDFPKLREYIKEIQPQKKTFYSAYEADMDEILALRVTPDEYPRDNIATLLDQGIEYVHPNGTRDQLIHTVRQVLRPQGIREVTSYSISLAPTRERITVLAAKVHQPDGTVISSSDIHSRAVGGGGGEGTIYNRGHVKTIRFPQVQVGSVIELKYLTEATGENIYGNSFETGFFFGGNEPTQRFLYVISIPDSLNAKVKTFKEDTVKAKRTVSKANGITTYRWDAAKLPGFEMEPGMPPYQEIAPAIKISTFDTWSSVGSWYWDLMQESLTLPEELKKEVHKLTKDATTQKEKLDIVYYYVIDSVRYVGIELGRNGYVPHSCERTWRTHYGDCKDTAVLMVALLNEVGINANVALVRTWHRGIDPTDQPGPRNFNHAIAYVPNVDGKEYWLDGTTDYNHVSELPVMDQGALALICSKDGGKKVIIPEKPASANGEDHEMTIKLAENGAANIEAKISYNGAYAAWNRSAFATPEKFKKMLTFFLSRRFPGAQLKSFTTTGSDLRKKETALTFTAFLPRMAKRINGKWKINPWLLPQSLSRLARQDSRKHDLRIMLNRRRSMKTSIYIMGEHKLKRWPQDISTTTPFGTIKRSSTRISANKVSANGCLKISYESEMRKRRIAQKDYKAFRRFVNDADSAQADAVIYTLPEDNKTPTPSPTPPTANDEDEWQ